MSLSLELNKNYAALKDVYFGDFLICRKFNVVKLMSFNEKTVLIRRRGGNGVQEIPIDLFKECFLSRRRHKKTEIFNI